MKANMTTQRAERTPTGMAQVGVPMLGGEVGWVVGVVGLVVWGGWSGAVKLSLCSALSLSQDAGGIGSQKV